MLNNGLNQPAWTQTVLIMTINIHKHKLKRRIIMQHKIAIGLMLMIFSMIGIICLKDMESEHNQSRPGEEVKKPSIEVRDNDIPKDKSSIKR